MQQRERRLGDILDDYCPRERRLTNHAIVAMIGTDVKQTRCTTCDAEHEYKHAKVPRQRKKADAPAALYSQVVAGGPKRVVHEPDVPAVESPVVPVDESSETAQTPAPLSATGARTEAGVDLVADAQPTPQEGERDEESVTLEEGPVHRPLIRATLPRPDGQTPSTRPAPDFTIRQPGGRANRFRPRHQRGGAFAGNRPNGPTGGGGPMRGGPHSGGNRPPHGSMTSRLSRRHGPGRKRSK
jgi:hypothetical protein